ncbi:MAG: RAMP superfamily CRISPR-associated protein [Trichloromonas sp.]|jgi:CRISPR/Cas system CSM-associated protein Csm3 (group 7 of RAMP superfamily)|nr:RAMP superfamily CRISPR-associated protein [Trichloromonas sp.]
MSTLRLKFEFLSPWLMGSGFGEGAHLDAVPVKSPNGLPYIPGKSVKGLLREAVQLAEELGRVPEETTLRLFGSRDKNLSRYETSEGSLRFSSAVLEPGMETWAGANRQAVPQLFIALAATRIDTNGLAHDKTLRKIEAALPVSLTAELAGPSDDTSWQDHLRLALPLLRQAGSHRHRGLGRVSVHIEEVRS